MCYRCGHLYHKANQCYALDEAVLQSAKAFSAMQIADPQGSTWYMDTGASHTMTADQQQVQGKASYTSSDSILVGNGKFFPITHTGKAKINLSNGTVKTSPVLLVPSIARNLISVSQFAKSHNCYFVFDSLGYVIKLEYESSNPSRQS